MEIQPQYFSEVQKEVYKILKIKKFFDELKSENYNNISVAKAKNTFEFDLKALIDEISKQII